MFPLWDNVYSWSFPWITYILIMINCIVFVLDNISGHMLNSLFSYKLSSDSISINLITYQFLHANFLHIFGNMWFLHVFGNNVEDKLGHFKFLFFYLLFGALAAIGQATFMSTNAGIIGASGSISGVLGAYLIFFPRAKIKTLLLLGFIPLIFSLPAFAWLILWFVGQDVSAFIGLFAQTTNVAFFAHITGFSSGIIIGLMFRRFEPKRISQVV
ncbi:rhomboid family intramembrane serine protease [Thermodesulfobium sp. 4217-1]|uniref:rhomboid family intramembrane serine protease n=1 Tax=Thermodesulfobium sp. 4217-1 TaxID=3120013 RepID=UPI003221A6B5